MMLQKAIKLAQDWREVSRGWEKLYEELSIKNMMLRGRVKELEQLLSGEVGGNEVGVPTDTTPTRPTTPCPNPRCHKGWVMVQDGGDDIDHDLCPICDGNMFITKAEGKDGGK